MIDNKISVQIGDPLSRLINIRLKIMIDNKISVQIGDPLSRLKYKIKNYD